MAPWLFSPQPSRNAMMDVPPDAHGQTEAPGDALSMLKPPAISASWWKKKT